VAEAAAVSAALVRVRAASGARVAFSRRPRRFQDPLSKHREYLGYCTWATEYCNQYLGWRRRWRYSVLASLVVLLLELAPALAVFGLTKSATERSTGPSTSTTLPRACRAARRAPFRSAGDPRATCARARSSACRAPHGPPSGAAVLVMVAIVGTIDRNREAGRRS